MTERDDSVRRAWWKVVAAIIAVASANGIISLAFGDHPSAAVLVPWYVLWCPVTGVGVGVVAYRRWAP